MTAADVCVLLLAMRCLELLSLGILVILISHLWPRVTEKHVEDLDKGRVEHEREQVGAAELPPWTTALAESTRRRLDREPF
jgi:hypothetical protein